MYHYHQSFQVYSDIGRKHYIDILFEFHINTWTGSKDIPCNAEMNTKYDKCIYEGLRTTMLEEFNCTIPFLPEIATPKDAQYDGICGDPETRKNAYEKYDLLKRNNENKLCPNPCSTIRTYFGILFEDLSYEEKGIAYLKIYLQSMTTIMVTVMDYDGVAMVADIGGYTGLLLGFSATHLSRFLFKTILMAINAPRRKREGRYTRRKKRESTRNTEI